MRSTARKQINGFQPGSLPNIAIITAIRSGNVHEPPHDPRPASIPHSRGSSGTRAFSALRFRARRRRSSRRARRGTARTGQSGNDGNLRADPPRGSAAKRWMQAARRKARSRTVQPHGSEAAPRFRIAANGHAGSRPDGRAQPESDGISGAYL